MTKRETQSPLLYAAILALTLSPSMAAAIAQPQDYDLNGDGQLSPAERVDFEAYVNWLEATDHPAAGHYRDVLDELAEMGYPNGTAIPVARIWPDIPDDKCDYAAGFVLRRDVTAESLTTCKRFRTPSGAIFSLSREREADSSTVAINGGIAYAFAPQTADGAEFRRHALALFLQADGAHISGETDRGAIRTGLRWDMAFAVGPFDLLTWSNQFYHQTDFELDGSGYGLKSRLVVQRLDWHIGGAPRRPGASSSTYLLPGLALDALHVNQAGGTQLVSGDDYLWAIADAELVHENDRLGPHGGEARLKLQHAADLDGGDTATWGTLSVNMFLDAKKQTALNLTYTRGHDYRALEKEDRLTLGISYWF